MYKKIMVPLDGSKLAECVLPHIATVVKGSESPEVIVVRAVEPLTIPYGREVGEIKSLQQLKDFETHSKTEAEQYLKEVVDRLVKSGINAKAEVIYGKAADALVDFVCKNDIDLVIIATHGRSGISRWVWGSVAERVLHSVCANVLMVVASKCASA